MGIFSSSFKVYDLKQNQMLVTKFGHKKNQRECMKSEFGLMFFYDVSLSHD